MSVTSLAEVGVELPDLVRPLRAVDLVAYAGATWDWHRLHFDQTYAASRGLPAPIVDGQMFGALLVEQVQDAFGPKARVIGVTFRFAAMVYADEVVRVRGRVIEVVPDRGRSTVTVEQSITVEDEEGRTAMREAQTTAVLATGPGGSG